MPRATSPSLAHRAERREAETPYFFPADAVDEHTQRCDHNGVQVPVQPRPQRNDENVEANNAHWNFLELIVALLVIRASYNFIKATCELVEYLATGK